MITLYGGGPKLGFNTYFFKKTWAIVRQKIIMAVQEFFVIEKLPKAIICTTMTLIPTEDHHSKILEYRPTSCCIVVYKIISNVISNRM